MFESLIGLLVFVALIAVIARQQSRLTRLEREFGTLRGFVLSGAAAASQPAQAAEAAALDRSAAEDAPAEFVAETVEETVAQSGPWSAAPAQDLPEPSEAAPRPERAPDARPDIETALGTRWAVWVGGVALALGGVFLVRYSIEAGIFGPGVRLTLAALLGLVLVAGGEFIRRTGFKVPLEGVANAYIPAILTAAGAFTLFGAVYAAHGVYGFIGPALAFTLMGLIGVGTIAAALVHGQALAGVGLLGALATPFLVASQSPSAWALFGYLAIVVVANTAIARLRDWVFPAAAGLAGAGLWCLLYLAEAPTPSFAAVLFINAVMLAALALIWLAGRGPAVLDDAPPFDWPSVAVAFPAAFAACALLAVPEFQAAGGMTHGALLIVAMLLVALYRRQALALLHAAGVATVLAYARTALAGSFVLEFSGGELILDGFEPSPFASVLRPAGLVLSPAFLAAGGWAALRLATTAPSRAAAWAGWGALAPLVVLASLWIAFGNPDRDFAHAAVALILTGVFVAGAEVIARRGEPPLAGGLATSFALAGAGVAAMLMLHMAFGAGLTTILVGAAAAVPAFATRYRIYPALGWLCVGAAVVVLARVAFDPTVVGWAALGTTPVLNALLPGYGIPALAFGFAAWQLKRTTNGRPRLAMEAAAALFALLTLAMLVRHAMNGGVIDSGAPTLAEQAIYTLIAFGAGAILIALDGRSPSPVMRQGSLAAGVVSVALVVAQHFILLNPVLTNESTGRIPGLNLLFLAYLLPALAAGALALYARGKRPGWYPAMLGLVAAALAFAYVTLSVRRLFQGEFIGAWKGMGQIETYAYSAVWLAMGVGLLALGVRLSSQALRIASAVLIAVAVAKVFIFDMSELEGALRALSFIGLGAVLIGIGLFYQKLLTRAGRSA